jgi:hypothetical protein
MPNLTLLQFVCVLVSTFDLSPSCWFHSYPGNTPVVSWAHHPIHAYTFFLKMIVVIMWTTQIIFRTSGLFTTRIYLFRLTEIFLLYLHIRACRIIWPVTLFLSASVIITVVSTGHSLVRIFIFSLSSGMCTIKADPHVTLSKMVAKTNSVYRRLSFCVFFTPVSSCAPFSAFRL